MLFHPQAAAATETQALLLFGRYLVLAVGEEGAWILDVWRAYQRVIFEVFQKKGPLPSQGLLFPVHAPIEPPLVPTLQSWQKALVSYGFEMELRENREAVLHALPAGFAPTWAAPLLEKLLKQAREASETTPWPAVLLQIVDSVLASQRPRTFTLREATDIAEHLLEASDPNFTPRGQAIRFFLSQEALRQLFE
jgi:DNA mismatch repair ATPase MutL